MNQELLQQEELVRQLVFLSSILLGFSIALAMQLITSNDARQLASVVIALFLLAGAIQLIGTWTGVVILVHIGHAEAAELTQLLDLNNRELDMLEGAMLAGLIVFLAGIALSGWLRSRGIGIVAGITSLGSLAAILYIWMLK